MYSSYEFYNACFPIHRIPPFKDFIPLPPASWDADFVEEVVGLGDDEISAFFVDFTMLI